jgi:hypothetical protein
MLAVDVLVDAKSKPRSKPENYGCYNFGSLLQKQGFE